MHRKDSLFAPSPPTVSAHTSDRLPQKMATSSLRPVATQPDPPPASATEKPAPARTWTRSMRASPPRPPSQDASASCASRNLRRHCSYRSQVSSKTPTERTATAVASTTSSRSYSTRRPTPSFRLQSTHTLPTTHREIDDVLALHFRSCSLFPRSAKSSPAPSAAAAASQATPPPPPAPLRPPPAPSPSPSPRSRSASPLPAAVPCTVTHWSSPGTRRREHAEIDRRNRAVRRVLRRVLPRCLTGPPPPRFYDERDHASDAGSVRRYRVDLPDDPSAQLADADEARSAEYGCMTDKECSKGSGAGQQRSSRWTWRLCR